MRDPLRRRRFNFRALSLIKLAALFLLLTQGALAQEKTCLEQLKDLRLESLPGKVQTHFSPGQRIRASEMKALLEEAGAFYERSLGLTPVVTLAALAPQEWPLLLDRPYGLPTMRTGPCKRGGSTNLPPQYLAIMPITAGGPIYDGWISLKGSLSPETIKKLKKSGITFEQAGRVFVDFVALHELGHAYAHAMGINTVSSFFAEFTANYFAYAFLRSTKERLDKRTMLVLNANLEGITPIHASLDKFEKFQSREHPPTEAWYNSAFTVKAAEVYEARGFAFLREVRDAFAGEKYLSITNEEILRRLEKIQPGFVEWAQHLPRLPEKRKPVRDPKNIG
jgi:hypothetical protein